MDNITELTCNNCGTVHFSITREMAELNVQDFNKFYDAASKSVQGLYGGRSVIERYERCSRCNNSYTNFRPAAIDDCPIGCTLSPIIGS